MEFEPVLLTWMLGQLSWRMEDEGEVSSTSEVLLPEEIVRSISHLLSRSKPTRLVALLLKLLLITPGVFFGVHRCLGGGCSFETELRADGATVDGGGM
jgi:hypothetical protein